MAFKETNCCTSVDGENFASAMETGFLRSAKSSEPYQRGLAHIEQRNAKIMRQNDEMGQDNFRAYDETETVNQS